MIIKKKFNNNILLAEDENHNEVVLLGKSIAFEKKVGERIDETLIEKKFVPDYQDVANQFIQLLNKVPLQQIDLVNKIITNAEKELNVTFNDSIYIGLTDHLNYALTRAREHMNLKNAMLWEIKKFYAKEFAVALKALDLIAYYENVKLSEDEAGYIALHFVNAQQDSNMETTILMTDIVQDVVQIIKFQFNMNLDEHSLNYSRLITHLRYFTLRMLHGELAVNHEDLLFNTLKNSYHRAYECALKIKDYFYKRCNITLTNEELSYLIIHINRVTTRDL